MSQPQVAFLMILHAAISILRHSEPRKGVSESSDGSQSIAITDTPLHWLY